MKKVQGMQQHLNRIFDDSSEDNSTNPPSELYHSFYNNGEFEGELITREFNYIKGGIEPIFTEEDKIEFNKFSNDHKMMMSAYHHSFLVPLQDEFTFAFDTLLEITRDEKHILNMNKAAFGVIFDFIDRAWDSWYKNTMRRNFNGNGLIIFEAVCDYSSKDLVKLHLDVNKALYEANGIVGAMKNYRHYENWPHELGHEFMFNWMEDMSDGFGHQIRIMKKLSEKNRKLPTKIKEEEEEEKKKKELNSLRRIDCLDDNPLRVENLPLQVKNLRRIVAILTSIRYCSETQIMQNNPYEFVRKCLVAGKFMEAYKDIYKENKSSN